MTTETSTGTPSGKTTLTTYAILLAATILLAVFGLANGDSGDLILTAPVIGILAATLISERHALHLPPLTVMMIWLSMLLTIVSRVFSDGGLIAIAASVLTGVNLTLIGLIAVFILLRSMPGTRDENPMAVVTIAASVAIAVFMLMNLLQYAMTFVLDFIRFTVVEMLMAELCWVIVGTIIVSVLFLEFRDSKLFKYTVNTFLESNSGALGLEERERLDLEGLILEGESDRLEFKSTVRTNLETGETDKRMEKAVLKTIVAFLNTDGGTLLIGVSDDGGILGADVESFGSVDRMNLHMTNMISSAIGNGFIPYINFKPVPIDGKYVVRVKCDRADKAVFLKEGKSEQFYVRSGPSSVELTGMNLVNYVNNRNKKGKRFGSRRGSVLLGGLEGVLGLSKGPGDEQGHDDGQDGHYDGIDDQSDEAVAVVEHGLHGGLDGFVPGERGHEPEGGGDESREGLEQLDFQLFSCHAPAYPFSVFGCDATVPSRIDGPGGAGKGIRTLGSLRTGS